MSTIDPGVEDQLKASAKDVEADNNGDSKDWDKEEEENLMDPSSWWFASTACPLLAGTFGPLASGFSICALVYSWRVYVPDGSTEDKGVRITDPNWALAVNGISLGCAVVGNASLLLNMARRLRFSIAQPITITGFLLAGFLLVGDMAGMSSGPDYWITEPRAIPPENHALSSAFYYAGFAAGLYIIVGFLMCLTVYGADRGYYEKDFNLTPSQRTLMLQTMSFIAYLLLGALIFSYIENWNYLDGVYWADVTLLTVGLGDFSPQTNTGRGLLFPFATSGILIVGLVVGSIRSLVLERGKEKMSARIIEKRRETAVHNVNENMQTIKISWFGTAGFSTDPTLSPAQRREEEFNVMRKLQRIADRERRYFSLAMSMSFVLLLWFVGAVIFMEAEKNQGWTYFNALYFTFTSLLTIGYGDFSPQSNFGRPFFVFWSLLAVPSLTILISTMGDTIVKWFADITVWVGSVTVLPGEGGVRATTHVLAKQAFHRTRDTVSKFTAPGILGAAPNRQLERMSSSEHWNNVLDRLADRLTAHVEDEELNHIRESAGDDDLRRDTHFYHYVLSRECRNVQKNLSASPPKQYDWGEWEYFLRLMGNRGEHSEEFPGQKQPDMMVPGPLQVHHSLHRDHTTEQWRTPPSDEKPDEKPAESDSDSLEAKHVDFGDELNRPRRENTASTDEGLPISQYTTIATSTTGDADPELRKLRKGHRSRTAKTDRSHRTNTSDKHKSKKERRREDDALSGWSWLSDKSPLMSTKSESEWILERLSAALERELHRTRKGYKKQPPISMRDLDRENVDDETGREEVPKKEDRAQAEADATEMINLALADRGA